MKHLLLLIIKIYQKLFSGVSGRRCRFYPTCSQYAKEAITMHGAIKGTHLAIKRILKCHSFNPGGYDPVK